MEELLRLLSAGGDTAMIALFFLMWKFDRRLLRIEERMRVLDPKKPG